MKLKTKISSGLGFLFLIIFTLIVFSVYYIDKISVNSENIIKDNYKSLVYVKNMNTAIDNILVRHIQNNELASDKAGDYINSEKNSFERNFSLEKGNITEPNEKNYVENLDNSFKGFISLVMGNDLSINKKHELYSGYRNCRVMLDSIDNVNMRAIVNKNHFAKEDSDAKKMYMAIVAAVCLILAFFYFWYFPFYVTNTISILAAKMKGLLKKAGIDKEIKTNDESFIILESIELLNKKLD